MLAASLDLQRLVAFEDDLDLPPESVVQVLDAEGRVVARSEDIDEYLMGELPSSPGSRGPPAGTVEGRGVDGACASTATNGSRSAVRRST